MKALRDPLFSGKKIVLTSDFSPFKCFHCPKIFINDFSLKKHVQKRHTPMGFKMPTLEVENYNSINYLTQVLKKPNLPVLLKENRPHYPLYDTSSNVHYSTYNSKQKKPKIHETVQDAMVYCVKMDENWTKKKTKSNSYMQTLINNNENTTQTDSNRRISVKVGTNEIKKNIYTQTFVRVDTVGTTMCSNVKFENEIKTTQEKACGTKHFQNNISTQTIVKTISVGVGSEKIILKNKSTTANLEEIKNPMKNVSTNCENLEKITVGTSMDYNLYYERPDKSSQDCVENCSNKLTEEKDLASSYIESCSNTLKTDEINDKTFEKEPILIYKAMETAKSENYFELLDIKPKTSPSINSIRDVLGKRQCSTKNRNMVLSEFQVAYYFEMKMREIDVNPEWDKLPLTDFKNALELLNLKRDILIEKDPEFCSNQKKLRQEINDLLEQKIHSGRSQHSVQSI